MLSFTTRSLPIYLVVCAASLLAASCGSSTSSKEATPFASLESGISEERLGEHTQNLAADVLQGRAPGSRGEERTMVYLTEQYADMGLRPGNPDGTYVQAVPLMRSRTVNRPNLHLKTTAGERELRYFDEFMAWTLRQVEQTSVDDSELVFVGYGIVAPEYDWDDYKDVDVSGKIIVMLVNDPPLPDTTQFGGRAMTYYGRWTYKYEIAAEKGAAGAIIVHKTETAGYPWAVVANSWSNDQFDVVRAGKGLDRCAMEGWVTTDIAEQIFSDAGYPLETAYEAALSRDFKPVPLGITGSVEIRNDLEETRSHNVVAKINGSDPALRDEFVVYTAHWDHLGIGAVVDGDSIYNGALDNATGVAATLEIARSLMAHSAQLKRSVLIMNTTAEESGLLGAYYYADHPLYPLEKTVAVINLDGMNVWGKTKDVVVVGYGYSELDNYLRTAIVSQDRYLKPDTEPEKGYYYRSDHLAFAKKGVPSLYADSGVEYRGRPDGWGLDMKAKYTSERYHKPGDEYDVSWDLSGAAEDAEAFVRVGLMAATASRWPEWSKTSEFRAVRQSSLGSDAP